MIIAMAQISLIAAGRLIYIVQKKGSYFIVRETQWQGEHNALTPLGENKAIEEYENMYDQIKVFESAFPDVKIEDA